MIENHIGGLVAFVTGLFLVVVDVAEKKMGEGWLQTGRRRLLLKRLHAFICYKPIYLRHPKPINQSFPRDFFFGVFPSNMNILQN